MSVRLSQRLNQQAWFSIEDSGLTECYTVPTGKHLPTFRRQERLLGWLDPKDEGTTILPYVKILATRHEVTSQKT